MGERFSQYVSVCARGAEGAYGVAGRVVGASVTRRLGVLAAMAVLAAGCSSGDGGAAAPTDNTTAIAVAGAQENILVPKTEWPPLPASGVKVTVDDFARATVSWGDFPTTEHPHYREPNFITVTASPGDGRCQVSAVVGGRESSPEFAAGPGMGNEDQYRWIKGQQCVIEGLADNTTYTFSVVAGNTTDPNFRQSGDPEALFSDAVTSVATVKLTRATRLPAAPTGVRVDDGGKKGLVRVWWDGPTKNATNSQPVTGVTEFTVVSRPGGETHSCTISPCTLTLPRKASYTFTVAARNTYGLSSPSEPSAEIYVR